MAENETLEEQKRQRNFNSLMQNLLPLKKYLDEGTVTDIFTEDGGEIVIKDFINGKIFTGEYIKPAQVERIILSCNAFLGKDALQPINGMVKLEAVIPAPYKARITGLLPPCVETPQLTLRKPPARVFSLEEYVESGRMKQSEYSMICDYIKARKNILIGGATGSGKTTFTNAVIKKMVEYTPKERFYIVEDVQELQCGARDKVMIEVNPKGAAEAVRTAMRLTPDRIIFGEVRYGEVVNELLKSWNTGHTGNVTTVHADDATSMMMRMEDLLREEIKGTIPKISSVIHLCVHLTKTRVDEVLPTTVNDTDDFIEALRANRLV